MNETKAIPIILIDANGLTRAEIEALWDQDVCMDDWDYMLVIDVGVTEFSECPDDADEVPRTKYEPVSYTLGRLMVGCCDNRWYKAQFRGADRMIGVAYHA